MDVASDSPRRLVTAVLFGALLGLASGCGGSGEVGGAGSPPQTSDVAAPDRTHPSRPPVGASTDEPGRAYAEPLSIAIAELPVTPEDRAGYARSAFTHWVDDDGDGCDARAEVLVAEADDPVTVGDDCALSGGRWFSYYDRVSWTDPADLDIDHMVPLAEAWDSGADAWTATRRRAYANDLGDPRSLVGVTDSVNQAKGDQDPATWMPPFDRCRYLREFVAVKVRWRLAVDPPEQEAMTSLAAGCRDDVVSVVRAD